MANIFVRFPGGKVKAVTLSYDDGVEQDIRLIKIMKENGLKGTFNLSSGLYAKEGTNYEAGTIHRRMTRQQAIDVYQNSGMEIAVHGLTHPFLEHLSPSTCTYEVLQDRINLETEYGTIIRGMAYPYGSYSDSVVDCLKHCGIAYSRTTKSTESFGIPTDWLRMPATCHHNNLHLMELAKKFVEDSRDRTPMLFYLWGHSYEFERDDNWEVIEEFAEYIGKREDIWYATNIEIYDYMKAFGQLIFSADGRQAWNPTAIDLYLKYNGRNYCIRPDEKILFEQI